MQLRTKVIVFNKILFNETFSSLANPPKKKLDKLRTFYKNSFAFFAFLYLFSFLIPATIVPSTVKTTQFLYGWEAATWATLYMDNSILYFIGGLSNFIILLTFLFKIIAFFSQFICISTTSISVGIWCVFEFKPLLVGYYLWAVSSILLCLIHSQQLYIEKMLNQEPKEKKIIEHLIEGSRS